MPKLLNKYNRNMQHHELYPLLGLKVGGHLPIEGMPAQFVCGVDGFGLNVYVKPKEIPGRRAPHRVIAICRCGRHVPFGRLAQHKCK